MPVEGVLASELEPLELLAETAVAVVVSIGGYLAAKLGLGWWRPGRRHL